MKSRLEQIDCIAARMEKAAKVLLADKIAMNQIDNTRIAKYVYAWANTDMKKLILRIDSSIVKYLKKYGVSRKIHGVGFVMHHFNWDKPKIFTEDITNEQVNKIRNAVQTQEKTQKETPFYKQLKDEVHHIVLLPEWFHKYYHDHENTPGWNNLNSREAYYKKMLECLDKQETYDTVKELQFNSSSIHSAAESIEILALTVHKGNKKYIIGLLEKAYYRLKKLIKDYCKTHSY